MRVPAAMVALLSAAFGLQAPPVFRSGVETVYVDAAVVRRGRPVTGLEVRNFQLRDNGVPQRIEMVAAESIPLELRLVCDASASLEGPALEELRSAAQAVVGRLREDDQASLLSFSDHLRLHPLRDLRSIDLALRSLTPGGRTAFRDALYSALVLSPSGRRSVVVALSDGWDNASWVSDGDIAHAAEASNATLHVVAAAVKGKAESPELGALRRIAERTGGRLWKRSDFSEGASALPAIVDALRHRYLLRYEPAGVRAAGPHEIDLRLRDARGEVQARHGYFRTR